ncbi:MAG: protein phosphatase 2C domain-containing protein [Gammaproteobacteria bacterium]|nr:protein phosphatase 2C domain-containing protein [Gammaproteobacteria bacterium]
MAIRYGAGTDVGLARDHNEDAYLVNDELGLWIVADGMGGHEAGEVASAIAVQTVNAAVARGEPLDRAMNLAHKAVLKGSRKGGPGVAGMGCTCVAARIADNAYEVAWVGDSRAYHWDGAQVSQISHDHSYVQTLVDLGVINEQEAIDHPDRSVLTQCLGSRSVDQLEVGITTGSLAPGDSLLLCSDGLTGEVDDSGITEIMADSGDEQVAVDRLIIAALENGGSDNVTVVVVSGDAAAAQVGKPSGTPDEATAKRSSIPNGSSGRVENRSVDTRAQPVPTPLSAAQVAAAAGRGGAAAAGAKHAAVQKHREQERRAAMGRQQPARKRRGLLSEEDRVTIKKILFMRISTAHMVAYVSRRMREQRRDLASKVAPLRSRLVMVGVYSRRAVLVLGVAVVSIGIAGGVLHTG